MLLLAPKSAARVSRLLAAASAAGLLTGGLALAAPTTASAATLVATCNSTSTDSFAQPLDPGSTDNPQSETYRGTGTITCLDVGGKLLARGTTKFSGSIAAAECTGDETSGSYTVEVDWSDGTRTTGTYTKFDELDADGTGAVTISGTTDVGSTKFAGYASTITGTSSGTGCGTQAGESSKSQTSVVTFSKL